MALDDMGIDFLVGTDMAAPLHTAINTLQTATSGAIKSTRQGMLYATNTTERAALYTLYGASTARPLWVDMGGVIYRTVDGATWTAMGSKTLMSDVDALKARKGLVYSSDTILASDMSVSDTNYHIIVTSPAIDVLNGDVIFLSTSMDVDGSSGATQVGSVRRGTTEVGGSLVTGVPDRIMLSRRDRVAITADATGVTYNLAIKVLGPVPTTVYGGHTHLLVEQYR